MDGHDCSVVWVEMMLKAMQYMWKIMGPGDKNEQYDDSYKYIISRAFCISNCHLLACEFAPCTA